MGRISSKDINQLKEMVALPLLYPELFQQFGITPPRGVLFHGPPGTGTWLPGQVMCTRLLTQQPSGLAGKTLLARALAASCSSSSQKIGEPDWADSGCDPVIWLYPFLAFFMRKGADCLSKWVGEAERQLRLLFEEAKNAQPSIIFFDEIDGTSASQFVHVSVPG
jgi:SpoVK/Ycf46/Vps4 family AAA+-type ATPase